MLMHAYAPGKVGAPELYCRYTWVKEIGVQWRDLGGISQEEISLLAELINIQREAERVKSKAAKG